MILVLPRPGYTVQALTICVDGRYQANGFNISQGLGSDIKRLLLSSSKTMAGEVHVHVSCSLL